MFSLIVTSIERTTELRNFLLSIRRQAGCDFPIEIIFVDQSKGLFTDVLNEFSDLNIVLVIANKCSLSEARNLGLRVATGSVFAFPDDDCLYYSNTLSSVYNHLSKETVKVVVGRIYDRVSGNPILKEWPNHSCLLSERSVFKYTSSITLFTKLRINFDECMGAGAIFGSCEDVDLLLNLTKITPVSYEPDIEVWHPDYSLESTTLAKAFAYGKGFGYFHRKHLSFFWAFHFVLGFAYSFLRMVLALVRMDVHGVKIRFYSILGRLFGFLHLSTRLNQKCLN